MESCYPGKSFLLANTKDGMEKNAGGDRFCLNYFQKPILRLLKMKVFPEA